MLTPFRPSHLKLTTPAILAAAPRLSRANGSVARCPPPDHDTGCTHCKPSDMSLFSERKDCRGTAPYFEKFLIVKTGTSNWPSKPALMPDNFGSEFLLTRRKVLDPTFPVNLVYDDSTPEPSPSPPTLRLRPRARGPSADPTPSPSRAAASRASDEPTSSVVMYPEGTYFPQIPLSDVLAFTKAYLLSPAQRDAAAAAQLAPKLSSRSLAGGHILVCGHTARDARCGEMGPLLVNEFRKVLAERGMLRDSDQGEDAAKENTYLVSLCTHVGGHIYAGNVIILKPGSSGLWYGNVFPENVQGIVSETLLKGNVIEEFHRGGKLSSD